MTRALVAGIGPAAVGADVVLDLGAAHPSTAGGLRLHLQLDGDGPDAVVVAAEPEVGFMHRGAEKLFEVRDYRQVVVLADRHDWLAAFGNELGVVLAVERMLGMVLPERAAWLRVLLAELDRVLSHLSFARGTRAERELVQQLLEEVTGGRLHVGFNRVGGLREDLPAGWTGRCATAVGQLRTSATGLLARAQDELAPGTGVLSRADALSYGASGPVARASGVDLDLRRDDPYLVYPELTSFRVVGSTDGDTRARHLCLLEQVLVSLDVVEECLQRLPSGPVSVKLPKTVKAPEGSAYAWTENPSGAMGWYLVSKGQKTPYRLAMRTASFGNVSTLPALLPGTRLADVAGVLASLFFVVGDIDK
ncbi:MAG: hypothetical protein JWN17_1564 [Frankiales bacterium]|nr:hypothetical protein [Frankiales bacterium]